MAPDLDPTGGQRPDPPELVRVVLLGGPLDGHELNLSPRARELALPAPAPPADPATPWTLSGPVSAPLSAAQHPPARLRYRDTARLDGHGLRIFALVPLARTHGVS